MRRFVLSKNCVEAPCQVYRVPPPQKNLFFFPSPRPPLSLFYPIFIIEFLAHFETGLRYTEISKASNVFMSLHVYSRAFVFRITSIAPES